MNARALIKQAHACDVSLRLEAGKVKVSGPSEAVARLLTSLREHRVDLMVALKEELLNPVRCPAPVAVAKPSDWQTRAVSYHNHHFTCPICTASGRGSQYGERCGIGTTLWVAYENTVHPS